ncbi:NTP transferase domain-containing protein [Candidatus Dependentiae bacterium]|nr:NTP transferase domain-containing protein [Candidatus Dependentiae bacterium]
MLENVQAIILAGGISERFHTGKTKLIEKICGTEMILYPIKLLKNLEIPITLVIGYQYEKIKNIIQKKYPFCNFVLQNEPLGTGHALQITQHIWSQNHILIMHADIPLLTTEVINKLYRKHIKSDADISFITAHVDDDSNQSSRLIINNNTIKLSDESNEELDPSHCCISAGIYLIKRSFLEANVHILTKDEITGEVFIQELVQIGSEQQAKIVTQQVSFDTVRSVETLADLWAIEHIRRSNLIQYWMDHGVRFANTLNIIIEENVKIEPGSFIDAGVILTGYTIIKKGCSIGAYTQINDSMIEDGTIIPSNMIISNAIITKQTTLQPFSQYQGNTQNVTCGITFATHKKNMLEQ